MVVKKPTLERIGLEDIGTAFGCSTLSIFPPIIVGVILGEYFNIENIFAQVAFGVVVIAVLILLIKCMLVIIDNNSAMKKYREAKEKEEKEYREAKEKEKKEELRRPGLQRRRHFRGVVKNYPLLNIRLLTIALQHSRTSNTSLVIFQQQESAPRVPQSDIRTEHFLPSGQISNRRTLT